MASYNYDIFRLILSRKVYQKSKVTIKSLTVGAECFYPYTQDELLWGGFNPPVRQNDNKAKPQP